MQNAYFNAAAQLLQTIDKTQNEAMQKAAALIADTVRQDGLIYTMGNGHSQSVALEPFHRSGTLACVSAVLDDSFNFKPTAHAATDLERKEGYTTAVMQQHDIGPKDVFIVISNSGRNPAGIDAALYARGKGAKVIVITALEAHKKLGTKSRHGSGKMLRDTGDVVLDNCVNSQETALTLGGKNIAPVSTIAGAAIINNIMYLATERLVKEGFDAPLYLSSNDGGDDNNNKLAARYLGRIKYLG
ncbi:MAG: SIS domain-containing protein [Elusimicrobiota bacterium]|jgi:uncharacterized phosphosugar-binding protein|nr:SIS domain-containing protein [Elusimicrobiota bacterium]